MQKIFHSRRIHVLCTFDCYKIHASESMATVVFILFWLSLGILMYTYVLYGPLIAFIASIRKRNRKGTAEKPGELPGVAIVIPAFNEATILAAKIENTLQLDYPSEKRRVIVITDGSTDGSEKIAASFPEVTVLHIPERKGKTAALQRAMEINTQPFTVFTDANALLNAGALHAILACYSDPSTGGVAGEKKIVSESDPNTISKGEGLYWRYESRLKRWDAEVFSVMGAAGELFSIRTELFERMPDDTLLDDLVQSMRICERGYRIAYAPEALAIETASMTLQDEWRRKVRIAAGGFQAMARLHVLTYVYRFPLMAFQFLSHRGSRWAACPPALVILFFSSCLLAWFEEENWPLLLLAAQVLFYLMALMGWALLKNKRNPLFLAVPFYFCMMHAAAIMGFLSFLKGRQTILWHKAARRENSPRN